MELKFDTSEYIPISEIKTDNIIAFQKDLKTKDIFDSNLVIPCFKVDSNGQLILDKSFNLEMKYFEPVFVHAK